MMMFFLLFVGYIFGAWKEVPFLNITPWGQATEESYLVHGDFDHDSNEDILTVVSTESKTFFGSYFKSLQGVFTMEGRVDFSEKVDESLLLNVEDTPNQPRIAALIWVPEFGEKGTILMLDTQKRCIWTLDPFSSEVKDSILVDLEYPQYMYVGDYDNDGHKEIFVSENSYGEAPQPRQGIYYEFFRHKEDSSSYQSLGKKEYNTAMIPAQDMKSLELQDQTYIVLLWAEQGRVALLTLKSDGTVAESGHMPSGDDVRTLGSIDSVQQEGLTFDSYVYSTAMDLTPWTYDSSKGYNSAANWHISGLDTLTKGGFIGTYLFTPDKFKLQNAAIVMSYVYDESGDVSHPTICFMKGDGILRYSKGSYYSDYYFDFQVGNLCKEYLTLPQVVKGFIAQEGSYQFTWVTCDKGVITFFYEY